MKSLLVFVFCFFASFSFSAELTISSDIYSSAPRVKHSGDGKFDSYLSMNVPFEPVAGLFCELLLQLRSPLKSRGEAHVTTITPIEYWDVLKDKITIEEIDEIANKNFIQSSDLDIKCLGVGRATLEGRAEQTYYIVLRSENLLKIRKEIQSLYLSRGGQADAFDPLDFYPHITVGFSKQDLHESDCVVKDIFSCPDEFNLRVVN